MALSHEDKKDVQKHMGKALANKVGKVTKDNKFKKRVKDREEDRCGTYT